MQPAAPLLLVTTPARGFEAAGLDELMGGWTSQNAGIGRVTRPLSITIENQIPMPHLRQIHARALWTTWPGKVVHNARAALLKWGIESDSQ